MTTTQTKSQLLPNGRTVGSDRARPYYVRTYGVPAGRWFGSLAAARRYARRHNHSLFFEYAAGCGYYLEGSR